MWGSLAFRIPTTNNGGLPGPNGILSPIDQSGTADLSVGGSAGVPSGCSSLNVNAIGSPVSVGAGRQRNLAVTANTYTHVLADERELSYEEVLP